MPTFTSEDATELFRSPPSRRRDTQASGESASVAPRLRTGSWAADRTCCSFTGGR